MLSRYNKYFFSENFAYVLNFAYFFFSDSTVDFVYVNVCLVFSDCVTLMETIHFVKFQTFFLPKCVQKKEVRIT